MTEAVTTPTVARDVTRILVVHEDPTMVLMLRRMLEAEARWDVTGARTPTAALDRLAGDAVGIGCVLIHWGLLDHGALTLMLGLDERSASDPTRRPAVLGMCGHWTEDDLARGVQSGLDGFLGSPVTVEALAGELNGLRELGETPTRTRLLTVARERLTREDDRLWGVSDDPAWRNRMSRLATRNRERQAERARVEGAKLLQRLDGLFGRPVGPEVVRILKQQIDQPSSSPEDIARQQGADGTRTRALLSALSEGFATGNPRIPFRSDVLGALAHVAKLLRERPDAEPISGPALRRLKALSAESLSRAPGELSPETRAELHHTLAGLLQVPAAAMQTLSAGAQAYVDASVLRAREQTEALDAARLALLQAVLAAIPPDEPVDRTMLRTLSAALGMTLPPDPGVSTRLLELASVLAPEPELELLDRARLMALEEALNQTTAPDDIDLPALRARLAALLTAVDPGAAVDLARVGKLLDAWDAGALLRVGIATVGAIVRVLGRGKADATVLRLYARVGAREPVSQRRLFESSVVLRELRPVPLLDSPRLLSILRAALNETDAPDTARMRLLVHQIDLEQAMDRSAAGVLADVPASRLERARVDAQLQTLATLLGVEPEALGLTPEELERLAGLFGAGDDSGFIGLAPEAVQRLRLLAVSLARPGQDPEPLLRRLIEKTGGDLRIVSTLSRLLGETTHGPARTALRTLIGLTVRACSLRDVEGHLSNGRVEAAVLATWDVPDTETRLGAVLNEAALALRNLGRGPEGEPLLVRALQLTPGRLNLMFNYARLKLEAGQYAEALALGEKVAALAPEFGMATALMNEARGKLAA